MSRLPSIFFNPLRTFTEVSVQIEPSAHPNPSIHQNGNKTNQRRGTILRFPQPSLLLPESPASFQHSNMTPPHLFAKSFSLTKQLAKKLTTPVLPHLCTRLHEFSISLAQMDEYTRRRFLWNWFWLVG